MSILMALACTPEAVRGPPGGSHTDSPEANPTFLTGGDLRAADLVLLGEAPTDRAGSVARGADLDGDGVHDLVVGAPDNGEGGAAYVVSHPSIGTRSLADAETKLVAEGVRDYAGGEVATGDVSGDGLPDLIVAANWHPSNGGRNGAVYVVRGPVASGTFSLANADAKLLGSNHDHAGSSFAVGDLDGDGIDDLVVGADSHGDTLDGAVYVVYGPISGERSLDRADLTLDGEAPYDSAGWSVATADLDQNGLADLIIGAPYRAEGGRDAGVVYVLYAPLGSGGLAGADARLVGGKHDRLGDVVAAVGDISGDGVEDLAVSADGEPEGAVYLFHGPISGTLSMSDADATLIGEDLYDGAGYSVGGPGDVNGDGFGDLLVGAPFHGAGGKKAGAAYLVLGPISGTVALRDAAAKWTGTRGDRAGSWNGVAGAGDVNGDGYADILVGSACDDEAGHDAGAISLIYGRPTR